MNLKQLVSIGMSVELNIEPNRLSLLGLHESKSMSKDEASLIHVNTQLASYISFLSKMESDNIMGSEYAIFTSTINERTWINIASTKLHLSTSHDEKLMKSR